MDRETFVRELEKSSGTLFRVSWSMLQNREDCRDAMQETALRAWEKRHTLRNEAFFSTWIVRILINASRDILRRRRRTVSLEETAEPIADLPDPALALALQRLPEKLRLPLVMQCSEGMTYADIARALRVTEAAVRGRIHRAKEALRKELEE